MSDTDKKPNFEVFTTPVGELVYPWLTRADTRYEPDGMFQTKLLLPFDGAQELIARLEGIRTDFIHTLSVVDQKKLNPSEVFELELDEESGDETGNVLLRFKLRQNITPKTGEPFSQSVVLVDAATGEAITAPIYGGTMARLKGQVVPYTNAAQKTVGVTLRLRACQVHELVTGTGDGGAFWSDFGGD